MSLFSKLVYYYFLQNVLVISIVGLKYGFLDNDSESHNCVASFRYPTGGLIRMPYHKCT